MTRLGRHLKARYLKLERWRRRLTPAVLWDGFMVYLAILNLGLIVFDITYLWLRPFYFEHVPVVTELYDRVKGIRPHPLTSSYVDQADALAAAVDSGAAVDALEPRLADLRQLTRRVLEESPFERSGMSRNLTGLQVRVRRFVAERGDAAFEDLAPRAAFERFWSAGGELEEAVDFYRRDLRPLLVVNYHREYDLDGQLVDHFWLLDLPFLTIFLWEFVIRWILAVRRRRYPKWFLFPLFNWYDVLGLVPVRELRFFRLFRIASIYVRLYRSERTAIGDDVVSRTVKYFANVVSEEISDMVSLRILNETQEEIRAGTHRRIIRAVAAPHRDVLARQLSLRMRDVVASTDARARIRAFLDANLERAVESADVLRRLPLPGSVVRPLVHAIGDVVFDAIVKTMAATLETEEGQETLSQLVAASIDGLVEELTEGEVEALAREISLDAIEHVKEAVRVRKWVDAETPIRLRGP